MVIQPSINPTIQAPRIIFVTGTDTGVGKTVLTGLLISHLRQNGVPALALKPFCSGSRADAKLLYLLQDKQFSLDQINPWYFPEPVAPLVSARKHRKRVTLGQVLKHIERSASLISHLPPRGSPSSAPILLLEGAGGLLVPLGQDFTVLDLIKRLRPEVLLVSANRLGTINHTLLSVQALEAAGFGCRVVLMNPGTLDASAPSNPRLLKEMLCPKPMLKLSFLRNPPCTTPAAFDFHARQLSRRARGQPGIMNLLAHSSKTH